jgi:hypothetical protein
MAQIVTSAIAMRGGLMRSILVFIFFAERPGSPTPGQWCSIANRDAIPAFGAAGLLGVAAVVIGRAE